MNTVVLSDENLELVRNFSCGKEGLDNYLKEQAILDQANHLATTTLVIQQYRNNIRLIGYYTLKNTSIIFHPDGITTRGFPAIELMYLAIDERFQRRGYGSKVLRKIIYKAIESSALFSAITVIILSAKEDVVEFYQKFRFRNIPRNYEMLYDVCRDVTTSLFLNLVFEE